LLEEILPKNTVFNDFEVEHEFPTLRRRVMLLNARQIYRVTASRRRERSLGEGSPTEPSAAVRRPCRSLERVRDPRGYGASQVVGWPVTVRRWRLPISPPKWLSGSICSKTG
jgi:hypothetical protein